MDRKSRTPRIVHDPEAEPCTLEDIQACVKQEVLVHHDAAHAAYQRLQDWDDEMHRKAKEKDGDE